MSAGLAEDSDQQIDIEMIEWADRIFVMEGRQRKAIERRFARSRRQAPIVVLGIADEYTFMDDELVVLLRKKIAPFVT